MAEQSKILEREYTIPLRRFWLNVPEYERTGKAIKVIKKFIAKHMKITDRDTDKVKLDVYFNNELWFKGRRHPPSKIKVKASKEGEIVKVSFVEEPAHVKFLKQKHSKFFRKAEKKSEKIEKKPSELKSGDTKPAGEKTEEQKTDEKEKEKSGEEQKIKQADQEAKAQKHITKVKEPKIQRMALKK